MSGTPVPVTPDYGRHLAKDGGVMGLIIGLLVLWVALVIIGFTIKALLWLAIVGLVLFVATGVFGAIRGRAVR
jgi:hypothetical protein